jgi:hypothetical protein
MKLMTCRACLRPAYLRSRCLMQINVKMSWPYCIKCCCLNNLRDKPCNDPRGLLAQIDEVKRIVGR